MDKIATQSETRKRTWVGEIVKTLISLAIVGAAGAFLLYMVTRDQSAAVRPPDTLIPLVGVVAAEAYQGPLERTFSGTVVPFREIRVAAEVSGLIVEKSPICRAGSYVRGGTELMVIDRQNYELELATVQSELKQSETMIQEVIDEIEGMEATIELTRTEVGLIERELERNRRLEGVASRSEIEQWERNLLTAKSQLVNRENSLRTAQSRLERMRAGLELARRSEERAQLNLDRTVIRAPSDGVIVGENVQQGDLVSVGSALFTFEDTRHAEVVANLSHFDLAWLKEHLPAGRPGQTSDELTIQDAYQLPAAAVEVFDQRDPSIVWEGELSRFDGIGRDEQTRTTPVRITVDQPVIQLEGGPRALVRGMFVKCRLIIPASERRAEDRLVSIPAKALRPDNVVWAVENHRLQRFQVDVVGDTTALDADGNPQKWVVVRWLEGKLAPGVKIVTSPLSQASVGTTVQLVGESGPPAEAEAAKEVPAKEVPANADSKRPGTASGT